MAGLKDKRGFIDKERLDLSERKAVEYWMKRWGVTRDQLTAAHRKVGRLTRDIAAELGLKIKETDITRHDVFVADECFLTGTAAEVIPVIKADGRVIGTGKPSAITLRMIKRFRELTRETGTPIFA